MMYKLSSLFIALALMVGVSALLLPAQAAHAAKFGPGATGEGGQSCASSFLGFPAWFDGLPRKPDTCQVLVSEKTEVDDNGKTVELADQNDLSNFIFMIILNVIEIALRLIGFIAVGFIIYGGFKYLTSAGSADRITAGRKIIQNAVIGLVISFFSVAIVNLVAGNIG
ncbi:MAG: hypothetical protein V4678_01135 [Patescibacteria group bacterium]